MERVKRRTNYKLALIFLSVVVVFLFISTSVVLAQALSGHPYVGLSGVIGGNPSVGMTGITVNPRIGFIGGGGGGTPSSPTSSAGNLLNLIPLVFLALAAMQVFEFVSTTGHPIKNLVWAAIYVMITMVLLVVINGSTPTL